MSTTPANPDIVVGDLFSDKRHPSFILNEHQEIVNIKLEPEERNSDDTASCFDSGFVDREIKDETDNDIAVCLASFAAGSQIELSVLCPFHFKHTRFLSRSCKEENAGTMCTCTRRVSTELSCSSQSTSYLDLNKTIFNRVYSSSVSLETNNKSVQKRTALNSDWELSNQESYDRHCFAVEGNLSGMINQSDIMNTVRGLELYSPDATYVDLPYLKQEIKTESVPVLDEENNISALMLIQNQDQLHFQKQKKSQKFRSIYTSKDFDKFHKGNIYKTKQSFSTKNKSSHTAISRSRNRANSAASLYARSLAGQIQNLVPYEINGKKKLKKRSSTKGQKRNKSQKAGFRRTRSITTEKDSRTLLEMQEQIVQPCSVMLCRLLPDQIKYGKIAEKCTLYHSDSHLYRDRYNTLGKSGYLQEDNAKNTGTQTEIVITKEETNDLSLPQVRQLEEDFSETQSPEKVFDHPNILACEDAAFKGCEETSVNKKDILQNLNLNDSTQEPAFSSLCEYCGKKFIGAFCQPCFIYNHTGKKPNECEHCGQAFTKYVTLLSHISHSHPEVEKSYKCVHCEKGFFTSYDLQSHIGIHIGEKPFHCDICGDSFIQKYLLTDHKSTHFRKLPFACELCDEAFLSKSFLNVHILSHTSDFKCEHCNKVFYSSDKLESHRYRHTGKKSFKCEYCGKAFILPGRFLHHMNAHKDRKPHICKLCDYICKSRPELIHHMKEHLKQKYECKHCNRFFKRAFHFKKHLDSHRSIVSKPYECKYCSNTYRTIYHLKSHMSVHAVNMPYKCEDCGKVFARVSSLKRHKPIHTGDKAYKCDLCNKQFVTLYRLSRHMLIHSGQKPFKCEQCGKSFPLHYRLTQHVFYIHSKVFPFPCKVCGKAFKIPSQLKEHMNLHKKEKSNKCKQCGKRCMNRREHMNLHKKEKSYKCKQCGKRFMNRSSLQQCLRSHSFTTEVIVL